MFHLFYRLSYLHSQKIVHRDVKTENMLLDKTRTVKIADFGVARVEASNPNDMTGETGTLGYMAPEVCSFLFFSQLIRHLIRSIVHKMLPFDSIVVSCPSFITRKLKTFSAKIKRSVWFTGSQWQPI